MQYILPEQFMKNSNPYRPAGAASRPGHHGAQILRAAIGGFSGAAFWSVVAGAAYLRHAAGVPEWYERLGFVFACIAFPVDALGWLFLWGDYPPWDFLASNWFNTIFGTSLWSSIGATLGLHASKKRSR